MKTINRVNFEKLNKERGNEYLFWSFIATESNLPRITEVNVKEPFMFEGIGVCGCREGYVKVSVDFITYTIEKNGVMVLLPNSVIQILEISNDFRGDTFVAGFDLLENIEILSILPIYNQIKSNPYITFPIENLLPLRELVNLLKKKSNEKQHIYRKQMIQHLISLVFLEFCAQFQILHKTKKTKSSHNEEVLKNFLTSIKFNCHKEHSVSFYANEQHLTSKYFSQVIKKTSNLTAENWIIQGIIIHSKIMLRTSDMSIQQISEYMNFKSPSHFGQFFKKYTGITPRTFRMQ